MLLLSSYGLRKFSHEIRATANFVANSNMYKYSQDNLSQSTSYHSHWQPSMMIHPYISISLFTIGPLPCPWGLRSLRLQYITYTTSRWVSATCSYILATSQAISVAHFLAWAHCILGFDQLNCTVFDLHNILQMSEI